VSVAHAELLPLPAHRATTREFAGVSTQSRALSFSVRRTVRPFIEAWSYAPTLPWPASVIDRLAFPLVPVPGTHRRRVDLPTCPAELLWAPGAAPPAAQVGTDGTAVRANIDSTAVLYLHGGAFLCCGLTTHRHLVSRISAATGAPVLAVGYRMLPRHPIRRAVEDGLDGLRWLVAHGYPVERVVIAGDSAGGGLAVAAALRLTDRHGVTPAALGLLSPWVDPGSRAVPFDRDTVLTTGWLFPSAEAYLGDGDPADPGFAPMHADLSPLPPTLIHVGTTEVFYPQVTEFARRLRAAGVDVQITEQPQLWHVAHLQASLVREAADAIVDLGSFLRSHMLAEPRVRDGG